MTGIRRTIPDITLMTLRNYPDITLMKRLQSYDWNTQNYSRHYIDDTEKSPEQDTDKKIIKS